MSEMTKKIGEEVANLIRRNCERSAGIEHNDSICGCMQKKADGLLYMNDIANKGRTEWFNRDVEDIISIINDKAKSCKVENNVFKL